MPKVIELDLSRDAHIERILESWFSDGQIIGAETRKFVLDHWRRVAQQRRELFDKGGVAARSLRDAALVEMRHMLPRDMKDRAAADAIECKLTRYVTGPQLKADLRAGGPPTMDDERCLMFRVYTSGAPVLESEAIRKLLRERRRGSRKRRTSRRGKHTDFKSPQTAPASRT